MKTFTYQYYPKFAIIGQGELFFFHDHSGMASQSWKICWFDAIQKTITMRW